MATDETARLAALRSYGILDTDPEQAFDDLTLLASQVCGTPIASISLIDEDRQWLKSRVGISMTETSRGVAFCSHAIEQHGIFVVSDALNDPRFRENPMVLGEPFARFYAGAPLVSPEGHALGTLCVIDRVPRTLTDAQTWALGALRRKVEAQLELRRNLLDLQHRLGERDRTEAQQAALVLELRTALDNVNKLMALVPYTTACNLEIVIPAKPSAIRTVSEGVIQLLQRTHWPESELNKIDLAIQEALANAVRHGCKGDPTKQVRCSVACEESGDLRVVVRDPGSGFDATTLPDPLDGENLLKPSGRGVSLIMQLMDEVAFADGGREVHMCKRRRAASSG